MTHNTDIITSSLFQDTATDAQAMETQPPVVQEAVILHPDPAILHPDSVLQHPDSLLLEEVETVSSGCQEAGTGHSSEEELEEINTNKRTRYGLYTIYTIYTTIL